MRKEQWMKKLEEAEQYLDQQINSQRNQVINQTYFDVTLLLKVIQRSLNSFCL